MAIEQASLKRSSVFILPVCALLFVVCEMQIAIQLWSKRGMHEFNLSFYFLPLLLLLPLAGGLALRGD